MKVSKIEKRSGSTLPLMLAGLACLTLAAWTAADLILPRTDPTKTNTSAEHLAATSEDSNRSRFLTKKIENVRPGDIVIARDDVTGKFERRKVVRLFRKKSDHLRILTFTHTDGTSQRIETTNEHPFWVVGSGWTNAEDLQPRDAVETADTLVAVLSATQLERHPEGIDVYNFEVENAHSYFVQQPNSRGPPLWVHNDCGPDGFIPLEAVENAARTNGKALSEASNSTARNFPQYGTPYSPLSNVQRKALKAKVDARTITQSEYKHLQWDRRFGNRRATGVRRFWAQERATLRAGETGTRPWTDAQRTDILAGRTPKFNGESIEGHHLYNALDHPHIANEAWNIYPATRGEHFNRWHGGNWQNDTFGRPLNPLSPEDF